MARLKQNDESRSAAQSLASDKPAHVGDGVQAIKGRAAANRRAGNVVIGTKVGSALEIDNI